MASPHPPTHPTNQPDSSIQAPKRHSVSKHRTAGRRAADSSIQSDEPLVVLVSLFVCFCLSVILSFFLSSWPLAPLHGYYQQSAWRHIGWLRDCPSNSVLPRKPFTLLSYFFLWWWSSISPLCPLMGVDYCSAVAWGNDDGDDGSSPVMIFLVVFLCVFVETHVPHWLQNRYFLVLSSYMGVLTSNVFNLIFDGLFSGLILT